LVIFSTLAAFEFHEKFTDRNARLQYLAELKWKDGFPRTKCKCQSFTTGHQLCTRRCSACRYNESATAYNSFPNLKSNP